MEANTTAAPPIPEAALGLLTEAMHEIRNLRRWQERTETKRQALAEVISDMIRGGGGGLMAVGYGLDTADQIERFLKRETEDAKPPASAHDPLEPAADPLSGAQSEVQ